MARMAFGGARCPLVTRLNIRHREESRMMWCQPVRRPARMRIVVVCSGSATRYPSGQPLALREAVAGGIGLLIKVRSSTGSRSHGHAP